MVLRVRRARGMCAGDAGVRASCAPQQRGPHAKRDARAEPEKGVRFLRRHVTVRAIKVRIYHQGERGDKMSLLRIGSCRNDTMGEACTRVGALD
jgi:hypothetical protein